MEQSAGHVCPPQELPVADEVWLRPYETCSTKQNPTTVISALVKQNHSLKKSKVKNIFSTKPDYLNYLL